MSANTTSSAWQCLRAHQSARAPEHASGPQGGGAGEPTRFRNDLFCSLPGPCKCCRTPAQDLGAWSSCPRPPRVCSETRGARRAGCGRAVRRARAPSPSSRRTRRARQSRPRGGCRRPPRAREWTAPAPRSPWSQPKVHGAGPHPASGAMRGTRCKPRPERASEAVSLSPRSRPTPRGTSAAVPASPSSPRLRVGCPVLRQRSAAAHATRRVVDVTSSGRAKCLMSADESGEPILMTRLSFAYSRYLLL